MNTLFEKTFANDIKKIADKTLKEEIKKTTLSVEQALTLKEIPRLLKLKGYRIHYRIRVGKYRIGVSIENDLVTFERFAHRKDFYKIFP